MSWFRRADRKRAAAPAVPQPVHFVNPYLDHVGGSVDWCLSCTAPSDAWCRVRIECGCESISDPERGPDGVWRHLARGWEGETTEWHVLEAGDSCHQTAYLGDGWGGAVEECYAGEREPVRAGAIDLSWDGDGYSWTYADEVAA